jgi:transcriptional regulator with XRE-family HTH domain
VSSATAAIRRVREAAGILQSKMEGLTDRQLRRIEQGESRATSAAITALAAAHGLDANAYMERLAKAMR